MEVRDNTTGKVSTTVPLPFGFESVDDLISAMESSYTEPKGTMRFPLNIRDATAGRMRGLSNGQLATVISLASIMYWNTGSDRDMQQCLFLAVEYVR